MAKKDKKNPSGLFIPAGIFIGMGFGFLFGDLVAGLFIGMGGGFIGTAVMQYKKN